MLISFNIQDALIIQYKDEFISFSTHSDQTKRFAIRDGAETIVADSLIGKGDHVWTLQFMTITKSSSQFVVRANDEKTFLQTTISFSTWGVISGGTAKPFINIKYLEMSANYNGLLKGLCGNMDG
jgi:hypothetical protein